MTVNDYLHSKASTNRIPINGTFELSPVCNFSCKMCYVRKTPEQIHADGKRLRTWQEWLELAKQCHEVGTLYLLLTGGEPFLYPGFQELYIALHKMGFLLSINSNGTMIDKETVAWLKEYAPSRINITLYGACPETYERICGNASGFDRAINAIRMLTEAGMPLVINSSMIPENAPDLEKIMDIGKGFGCNTRVATYMFPPARRDAEETDSRFTPEQAAGVFLRKAKKMISPEKYRSFLQSNTPQPPQEDWGSGQGEFMRCRAGRCSYWISWDGTMTACGITAFPIQVYPFREPFLDCWNRLTDAVRTTPVLSGCAGCDKREVCHPCVAMIHAETGDVNAKAPYLCRMAQCIIEQSKYAQEEACNGEEKIDQGE